MASDITNSHRGKQRTTIPCGDQSNDELRYEDQYKKPNDVIERRQAANVFKDVIPMSLYDIGCASN
jgi:hypothetical protein